MRGWLALLGCSSVLIACAATDPDDDAAGDDKADSFDSSAAATREKAVSAKFEAARQNPLELARLVGLLPKGGDLHSHLSGAVQTESLVRWGGIDRDCVSSDLVASVGPTCASGSSPMQGATEGSALWTDIVNAWSLASMKTAPVADRHRHFFDAFGKFGYITRRRMADMLVDVRRSAARDGVSYLELMIALGSSTGGRLGEKYLSAGGAWDPAALVAGRDKILADAEVATTIARTRADLDAAEQSARAALGCGGGSAEPACSVTVRYLVQATRVATRESVFGQFVYGFALAGADPRVVGVNLVQAEEDPIALANVHDQMVGIGFVVDDARTHGRPVPVALHAGELTASIVPDPSHLVSHVREAVDVAHASRIGHATDILGEEDADELVLTMANKKIAVEACLTSNQQLLGVESDAHPALTLIRHGVPVALATDDEGILRTTMNDEFVRAFAIDKLHYRDLKRAARASLAASFLPGTPLRELSACRASLIAEKLDAPCTAALVSTEKARAEWQLETALDAFETALVH